MYYVKKDMTCLQEITDGFNFKPESVAGGQSRNFPPNILARVCQESEPSFFCKNSVEPCETHVGQFGAEVEEVNGRSQNTV